MAKMQVDTMSDHSEIVHYDTPEIPLYIRKGILSDYPGKRAQCHWHDDIELICILDGKMNYYVNGKIIELGTHDGIIINTREMHYGYSVKNEDCVFICILFHPSLLSACKKLYQQYVIPLLNLKDFSYLYLSSAAHSGILEQIRNIWYQKETQGPFYVMNAIGILHLLWSSVGEISKFPANNEGSKLSTDVLALRHMVSFIHTHYREPLSLKSIADEANICKSKCCKVFQSQIGQSAIDFLNSYRLHISTDLLKNTSMSILDISLECGFNHLSYYSKLFLRYYGCTPSKYRQAGQ